MDWSSLVVPDLRPQLEQIIANASSDFTANLEGYFKIQDLEAIITHAHTQFYNTLRASPVHSGDELSRVWHAIVVDFYKNNYWGYVLQAQPEPVAQVETPSSQMAVYLRIFLVPTLILKGALLYFGLNYSNHPDEGYGWGLIIAIVLSICNFSYFLWKTRHSQGE